MSPVALRIVAVLILACWMSPGVGALGVGLHLALDHHGSHGAEHGLETSDLVQAAAHGHHHDAQAVPDHDHDARVDGSALALRPSASSVAVLPAATCPEVALAGRPRSDGSPRRGPPVPLFTAHCSLLL